jgi:ribosomal protein S27E
MVEWQCPFCNGKMYSSYKYQDQKIVICIYCGEIILNPYYQDKDCIPQNIQ